MTSPVTFLTNGVALAAAVYKMVCNSRGGTILLRQDIRSSKGGMWEWKCNLVQKSKRWRNGAQGVANLNRTQAPKVVVLFHFHQCHEFG